jgi:hypothetical protein
MVTGGADGQLGGVSVELARALASKLNVPVRLILYENPAHYNESLGKDESDVGLAARDPSTAEYLAFSDVFMEVDNGYVGRLACRLMQAEEVDRSSVKVAVAQGLAPDGFLTRTLKSAEVVRVPGGLVPAHEALAAAPPPFQRRTNPTHRAGWCATASSAWSSRDRISRPGRLTTTVFPARENTYAGCNGCPSATPASRSSMELVYTFREFRPGSSGQFPPPPELTVQLQEIVRAMTDSTRHLLICSCTTPCLLMPARSGAVAAAKRRQRPNSAAPNSIASGRSRQKARRSRSDAPRKLLCSPRRRRKAGEQIRCPCRKLNLAGN